MSIHERVRRLEAENKETNRKLDLLLNRDEKTTADAIEKAFAMFEITAKEKSTTEKLKDEFNHD